MEFRLFFNYILVLPVVSTTLLPLSTVHSKDRTSYLDFTHKHPSNPPTWKVIFGCSTLHSLNVTMEHSVTVNLTITNLDLDRGDDFEFRISAAHPKLVTVHKIITAKEIPKDAGSWSGNFSIEGLLLGRTSVFVGLYRRNLVPEHSNQVLNVIILRKASALDTVFKLCAGGFVMILYINFGAVLDLDELKSIVLRPIGPAIGFIGQFVIMPTLSFLIGYILFLDMFEMRLGLFFTGTTPGGGLSNIFTVLLSGNLNLSITMTALSNLAAFGTMPMWIFTLGALIYRDGNFAIPYGTIAMLSFSLVLPLSAGIAMQKYAPLCALKVSKLLKPLSLLLTVFIIVFGFSVNSYMFNLLSWKILIASSALPWMGYIAGWIMAVSLRQSAKDALTIAIETGIQNTGIAIFMLNFTLPQPQADMTSAVSVTSSMIAPLPLLAIYLVRKCFCRTGIEETEAK